MGRRRHELFHYGSLGVHSKRYLLFCTSHPFPADVFADTKAIVDALAKYAASKGNPVPKTEL